MVVENNAKIVNGLVNEVCKWISIKETERNFGYSVYGKPTHTDKSSSCTFSPSSAQKQAAPKHISPKN